MAKRAVTSRRTKAHDTGRSRGQETGRTAGDTGPQPRRIGGRYQLEEQIGRGGMATVFRAHDLQLDRKVALKMMRSELGDDPQFVIRFEAEARRAASVSHPNVVSIYDVGTDGAPYMVMELVRGGDVAKALVRHGRFEPTRAAALAAETAGALHAAHDAGIVHRDVKPGNILLSSDGAAKVADFGIARATGEDGMTRTGATLGSVEYFSPEQARGEPVTAASDVYALGVVLYEMLTARRPFTGDSPYAVATARLSQPTPDPRKVADVPPELAEITMRAMAVDRRRRYRTAGQMREALVRWLERAGAAAPPVKTAAKTGTQTIGAAPVAAAAVAASDGSSPEAAPSGRATPVETPDPAAAPAPSPARTPLPSPARSRPRRRTRTLVPLAFVLAALLVGGYLGGQFLLPDDPTASPSAAVAVGSAGGAIAETPTPSPTASPSEEPTSSPSPTAEPSDEPAATPPPATPVPPAATPVPPPVTPAPTPATVALAGPRDSVAAFYDAVADGRFDQAYALWSDRMKSTYPRQENLDQRFANTADIRFTDLFVADQSANAATVQANFVETYDSGSSRQFVGYWRLIRVDGRWLLNEPTY